MMWLFCYENWKPRWELFSRFSRLPEQEDLVELAHNIPIVVVVVYMSTENMFVTPSTSWWLEWLPAGWGERVCTNVFSRRTCFVFYLWNCNLCFSFCLELKELSSPFILQPWCVWTYWPMPWNASTTPRSAVSVRCCCVPARRWSSSSWLWWWSTDTLASSRSLTIIALARLLSTSPDVWTNAASSRHALMCPSTTLRSGPTICCPLVSSAMSFWPHPAALWITRRPGENIWEAKSLVSSSKMEII